MVTTEKHIEEMMIEAQSAADPSVRGEEVDLEDGVKGKMDVEHPGRVFVYDIRTGERSEVLAHPDYLRAQLLKTDRDPLSPHFGKRIFTTVKPTIEPFRGAALCPLHKDHRDSPRYRALGLRTCPKASLLNEREAQSHMELKHKREWGTIEAERKRMIEDEERELRRLNIESLSRAFAPQQTATPAAAPAAPVTPPAGAAISTATKSAPSPKIAVTTCQKCGAEITAKGTKGLHFARIHHMKVCPNRE